MIIIDILLSITVLGFFYVCLQFSSRLLEFYYVKAFEINLVSLIIMKVIYRNS